MKYGTMEILAEVMAKIPNWLSHVTLLGRLTPPVRILNIDRFDIDLTRFQHVRTCAHRITRGETLFFFIEILR